MESGGSEVGITQVTTEQVISSEATRNVLEKQQIRWAKRGDTSPSVMNVERLQFRNLTPVTVVAFDDGKPGQKIDVNGDGQTTVAHNAKVLRASGAAGLLTLNAIYTFTMWEDRVWHESQASGGGGGGGGGGGAGVTSFAGRAGVVIPVAGDYTPAFIGAVPDSHLVDVDPHTQYALDSEKGAAGGIAQLDGSTLVPKAQLGTGVADATKFLRGDSTWAVPAGGGAAAYSTYDDEVPPATAGAADDEFETPGLAGAWTQVNWAPTAHDVDTTYPGALYVKNNTSNNVNRALLKAIPAGDFTIITKIVSSGSVNQFGYAGLIMTDGTTNGAGNQYINSLVVTAAYTWQRYIQKGINFLGMNATLQNEGAWFHPVALLRIRRVGAVYSTAISYDGLVWIEAVNAPGFTPTHFGLFTLNNGMARLEVAYKYFRYSTSGTATFGGMVDVGGGGGGGGAPALHAASHQNGGSDEIDVVGLSGVLNDPQPPIIGAGATQAVAGNDARLTNARTPTAHTHAVADLVTTGTKNATTFLRGDDSWQVPAGGGGLAAVKVAGGTWGVPGAEVANTIEVSIQLKDMDGVNLAVAANDAIVEIVGSAFSAWVDPNNNISIAGGSGPTGNLYTSASKSKISIGCNTTGLISIAVTYPNAGNVYLSFRQAFGSKWGIVMTSGFLTLTFA